MKHHILSLLIVIAASFTAMGQGNLIPFKDGGYWGYKNASGDIVIPCHYYEAKDFSEGLAAVKTAKGWGYIDEFGNAIIECKYLKAYSFGAHYEGLAEVAGLYGKRFYIDHSGIGYQYGNEISNFIKRQKEAKKNESLAMNNKKGLTSFRMFGKWGFKDETGKVVIPVQFEYVHEFFEGLARVKLNDKWGLIDTSGKLVTPCQFDDIEQSFIEGVLGVKQKGKWGAVDRTGKLVVPCQFNDLLYFKEGLSAAKQKGKYGYIDKTGKIVIPCQFDYAWSFDRGLGMVRKGKNHFWIDKNGTLYTSKDEAMNNLTSPNNTDVNVGDVDKLWNKFAVDGNEAPENKTLQNYIAAKVGTFEQMLAKRGVVYDEAAIQQAVETDINAWQVKGEFEKTADYKVRVTEETRSAKIKELADKHLANFNLRYAAVKDEYDKLYKKEVDAYCSYKMLEFKKQDLTLTTYDADNETFMIKTSDFGDILLPVPIDKAPAFKQNWLYLKSKVFATFVPSGDDVALQSVKFGDYVYDSNTKAEYALVVVNYNFKPISFDNLNLSPIATENVGGGQIAAVTPTAVVAPKNVAPTRKTIEAGSASDVDVNIPKSSRTADNTFAVIVANAKYEHASHVVNAENDGRVMAQYISQTLGVPNSNIYTFHNATYGHITSAVDQLKQIASAFRGEDFNVIFYYVGHGIPNSETQQSYILPVDINPRNINVCYPLRQLYSELGALGASSVTVMVDACFSGANHGDGMLIAEARGVAIKAKEETPMGNMVVLSAAREDETAFPYQKQSHGLFTYWLLKKLQETKGDVTLGELSDFVTDKVKKTSIIENQKPQTPTTAISPALYSNWRSLRLAK